MDFVWNFAMNSADFSCVNGSTIQSVLRELLSRINSKEKFTRSYFSVYCGVMNNTTEKSMYRRQSFCAQKLLYTAFNVSISDYILIRSTTKKFTDL